MFPTPNSLTDSTEQCHSWETDNNDSVGQEICPFSVQPKGNYHGHKDVTRPVKPTEYSLHSSNLCLEVPF